MNSIKMELRARCHSLSVNYDKFDVHVNILKWTIIFSKISKHYCTLNANEKQNFEY